MKDNFLESDSLSGKRVVMFGINHIFSAPTINHIKQINTLYPEFLKHSIDQVYCVSFTSDPMQNFLLDKLCKDVQHVHSQDIDAFQLLLNKKGHKDFLHQYWQFACVLNNKNVEYYIEQPFTKVKILADTKEKIYSNIDPAKILQLTIKSV
jgi:peroxiredoxin